MSDEDLLQQFANGDRNALGTIYLRFRETLVKRCKYTFSCSVQDAEDLYQEAFVVLEMNLRSGVKIGTLEGYLFSIMRNMHGKLQKKEGKVKSYDDLELLLGLLPQEHLPYGGEAEVYVKKAMFILEDMKDVCNAILKLRLLYDWSYEAIQETMNYSSAEGAKNQFSRCLKKLRDTFFGRTK